MRIGWLNLAPLAFLFAGACTGFSHFWRKEPSGDGAKSTRPTVSCETAGGQGTLPAKLELQDVHYDGEWLSGRLLISPVTESVRLDKRLLSYHSVYIHSVADCGTGQPVKFMEWDGVPPPLREDDHLTLECGYWYGGTVRFHLFVGWVAGPGPECINAELTLVSSEGSPLGCLPVRAMRIFQNSVDGGTPAEVPPPPDAGRSDRRVRLTHLLRWPPGNARDRASGGSSTHHALARLFRDRVKLGCGLLRAEGVPEPPAQVLLQLDAQALRATRRAHGLEQHLLARMSLWRAASRQEQLQPVVRLAQVFAELVRKPTRREQDGPAWKRERNGRHAGVSPRAGTLPAQQGHLT